MENTISFIERLQAIVNSPATLESAHELRGMAWDSGQQIAGFRTPVTYTDFPEPFEEFRIFLLQSTGFVAWDDHEFWETEVYFNELYKFLRNVIESKKFNDIKKNTNFAAFDKVWTKTSKEFMSRYDRDKQDTSGW